LDNNEGMEDALFHVARDIQNRTSDRIGAVLPEGRHFCIFWGGSVKVSMVCVFWPPVMGELL